MTVHDTAPTASRTRPTRPAAPRPARSAGWPTSPSATAAAPCSPGSRRCWLAVGAVDRLRRRLQGRLLRAGLRLQPGRRSLLEHRFPAQAGDTVDVVVRADDGVTAPAVQADVTALLAEIGARAARRRASTTRTPRPAPSRPTAGPWSPTPRLDVVNPLDMPVADSEQLIALAEEADRATASQVALGGQTIQQAEQGEIGSEAHRPRRRRHHPAAHVRLRRRRRAADRSSPSPAWPSAARSPACSSPSSTPPTGRRRWPR